MRESIGEYSKGRSAKSAIVQTRTLKGPGGAAADKSCLVRAKGVPSRGRIREPLICRIPNNPQGRIRDPAERRIECNHWDHRCGHLLGKSVYNRSVRRNARSKCNVPCTRCCSQRLHRWSYANAAEAGQTRLRRLRQT